MKLFSSKRRVVIAAAVMLLALFVLRPGVSRLKARIANSISRAVARPVEIGSVHLRLLPPGFDLQNLVIYEDPAFGEEPMLRAQEVTAVVRLSSLVRGRLDVARLELTEPSLNLVRRADGRWSWEALLERTARTPLAPTAKSKSEPRPGFPYIEASSGRINFKAGAEKKSYALLNADFAVWQESENTWGVRLQAEPVRTDMSLSDAGVLRMNGTWQRAGSLRETPLQFSVEWDRVQLGQLSKLVSGNDKGWRGEVRFDATLNGTPAAMQVSAETSIDDFHRYDISSVGGMQLKARCEGRYSSVENVTHEIFCSAPVGNGVVTLHGDAGLPGVHRVNLALNFESVPIAAVAQLARRAKKNLPADLVATGSMRGNFVVKEREDVAWPRAEIQGRGEISGLRLQSASSKVDLSPGSVPFALGTGQGGGPGISKAQRVRQMDGEGLSSENELHVEYGPFPVALGRPLPAQARGWVGRSGYGMAIRGEAEVAHILRLASLVGLPAIRANVEGVAQLELLIAGAWTKNVSGTASGFSAPEVTGKVQLHNARAIVRGITGPIEISSAELQLSPEEARMEKVSARAADAHWTGFVSLPRDCGTPGACLVRFNFTTEEVGLSGLHEWLSSPPRQRRWYQVLSPAEPTPPSFLQNLRASGKVTARRLLIRDLVANRLSATLDIERGKLRISDCRSDLLGGKQRGDWQIDFSAGSPFYTGTGTVTAISLEQIADAMHDPWISGTVSGAYQLRASGADSAAFWQSAEGGSHFDLHNGVFSHIALAEDEPPLRVEHWQGDANLLNGKIEIKGNIIAASGAYEISGTASMARALDLKLTQGTELKQAHAGSLIYNITGTLAEPHITLAPQTQAQLKP